MGHIDPLETAKAQRVETNHSIRLHCSMHPLCNAGMVIVFKQYLSPFSPATMLLTHVLQIQHEIG